MGREIRRVPPDWKHPKDERGRLQPKHNEDHESAFRTWIEGREAWKTAPRMKDCTWEEWAGCSPDPAYYRPAWAAEFITAFQVYETVSEGTPVSPVFATEEELICWLAECGDGMGIGGTPAPLGREGAERWVRSGRSAPSMVCTNGKILSGVEFVSKEN